MVKSSSHNITIIGSGYVGMSLATLLSQYHKVTIVDIDITTPTTGSGAILRPILGTITQDIIERGRQGGELKQVIDCIL